MGKENKNEELDKILESTKGVRAKDMGYTVEEKDGAYVINAPEYLRNADYAIRDIKTKMPQGATTLKPKAIPTFTEYQKNKSEREKAEAAAAANKPKTLSDYLEEQRKSLTKDKTDAVKMQKYHALSDVFNALGKMGGAAIGGAIGGNMLDSAPNVGEYKESRGYLDAFENAKKANERLRALDVQEFQLAYDKRKRDEDRAYDKQTREAERAYKRESDRLNREWTAEQNRITREWQKAVADQDFERQAELKKELARMEQNFKLQYQSINNAHEEALKRIGMETVQAQYDLYNPKSPVMFDDGRVVNLTKNQKENLLENFKGKTIGGIEIDENNIDIVLRSNPDAFSGYFDLIGVKPQPAAPKAAPKKNAWKTFLNEKRKEIDKAKSASASTESQNGPELKIGDDLLQFERK